MSMTVEELFRDLPSQFNELAAVGLTKTVQWELTGEQPGVWAFEIVDGVGHVIPGGVEKPDTTFATTDTMWIAVAEGREDPMKGFMTGKIKVTGDMMLAMRVPEFFPTKQA